jgi:gamma-glutamylcysteine synthetase
VNPVKLSSDIKSSIDALAVEFVSHFPVELRGPRTIGREAEYPVVTATGEAADVRRLWEPLQSLGDFRVQHDSFNPNRLIVSLEDDQAGYTLEVGLGTVEVITGPCADLFELQAAHEAAMRRLLQAAARLDYRILGYGIQPLTPPSLDLMAPKHRYQVIYKALGQPWLWFTLTASDQVQIDISGPELVRMINFGNLMAPVMVALCANSPIWEGRSQPYISAREGQMGQIHAAEYRHGMVARPFEDAADFIETMSRQICLVLRQNLQYSVYNQPFLTYLAQHGPDFPAYLLHEHYIWNSARARTNHATIELRPACQQPWPEHMAAAALGLGLVEAAGAIEALLERLFGADTWPALRAYHQQVIAHGLAAPPPAPDLLLQIVTLAAEALRQRGRGEEIFIESLFGRLRQGANPAQRALQIFQQEGLAALVAQAAIPSVIDQV